jgi:CheY-like chemotaxis protein
VPNILIVDDDEDVREALGDLLAERGYRVAKAADGAAALVLLEDLAQRDDLPTLILLDLTMPTTGGLAFVSALQRRPALDALPVVVVTADGRGAEAVRGTPGVRAVVAKPFDVVDLEAVIETLAAPPTDPRLRTFDRSSTGLCSLCFEKFDTPGQQHWLKDAAERPERPCPTCRSCCQPTCQLSGGLHFYLCNACGQGWRDSSPHRFRNDT